MKLVKIFGFTTGMIIAFSIGLTVAYHIPIWLGIINSSALSFGLSWALGDIFEGFFG